MYRDFYLTPEVSELDSPLVTFPDKPRRRGRAHPPPPRSFKSPRSKKSSTHSPIGAPDSPQIYLTRNEATAPVSALGTHSTSFETGREKAAIPSRIPASMRILKQTLRREEGEEGFLHPETNMWNAIVFPRQYPDSREDVHILEGWMKRHMDDPALFRESVHSEQCESASLLARHQLYILDLAHHELVRQVSTYCHERGKLMSSVWELNRQLHEAVIKEQQSVMQGMHRRVLDATHHSNQLEEQMKLMERNHKEQVAELIANSEMGKKEKENSAFRKLQQDMILVERDVKIMESTLADLSVWFPNFHLYSNSVLRRLLPDTPLELIGTAAEAEEGAGLLDMPQSRLFKDLKRIEAMELGFQVYLESADINGSVPSASAKLSRDQVNADDSGDLETLTAPGFSGTAATVGGLRNNVFPETFLRSADAPVPTKSGNTISIRPPPSKNMRSIIYENQIQALAIKDYELKMKDIEFKSSQREIELKSKLLAAQQQIGSLSALVTAEAEGERPARPATTGGSSSGGLSSASNNVIILRHPFPQHQPTTSLAEELTRLADAYRGKNAISSQEMNDRRDNGPSARNITLSTPSLISIAVIQRVFQSFFSKFATELLPINMICGSSSAQLSLVSRPSKTSGAQTGGVAVRGLAYSHCSPFDLSIGSVELFILSQWNREAKLTGREARDRLKTLMWSVMVWLQSSSASYYYSSSSRPVGSLPRKPQPNAVENTLITVHLKEDLPRSAEENEKGMLLALSMLLGVRYRRPSESPVEKANSNPGVDANDLDKVESSTTSQGLEAAQRMVPGPRYPLRDEVYGQVFAASYLALQRYMRYNEKLSTSHTASGNIMERAARCPVPTSHIRRVLKRIVRIAPPAIIHLPPNFVNSKGRNLSDFSDWRRELKDIESDEVGRVNLERRTAERSLNRKLQQIIEAGTAQPWYLQMPQKRFDKIVSDCMTLSYKEAGVSCEAYDVIAILWDNIAEYHDDIKKALMELFSFADGVSGGSLAGFMFLSIVFNVLEISDNILGPRKNALVLEWTCAASVSKLDAEFFSQSILRSGALLTGIHALFENTIDSKTEVYFGLRYLYEKLLDYESVVEVLTQSIQEVANKSDQANHDIDEQKEAEGAKLLVEDGADDMVTEAPEASAVINATAKSKRGSKLGALHVPDIASLLTRCQMCLESIFGDVGNDINDHKSVVGSGTVPFTQIFFCYKTLEFLLTHFEPSFDFENVLTLEQDAIAVRFRRTRILRRVFSAWASCMENGGTIVIKGFESDDGGELVKDSSSDDEESSEDTSRDAVTPSGEQLRLHAASQRPRQAVMAGTIM